MVSSLKPGELSGLLNSGGVAESKFATGGLASFTSRLNSTLTIKEPATSGDETALPTISDAEQDAATYDGSAQLAANENAALDLFEHAEEAADALYSSLSAAQTHAETASQAATPSSQRAALDEEVSGLIDQYNSIVSSTSYGGVSLLNGSAPSISVQGPDNSYSVAQANLSQVISADLSTQSSATTSYSNLSSALGRVESGAATIRGGASRLEGAAELTVKSKETNLAVVDEQLDSQEADRIATELAADILEQQTQASVVHGRLSTERVLSLLSDALSAQEE